MSRPRKSISKRKSMKKSTKRSNSKSMNKVNSIRNEVYPTGGKTHVKNIPYMENLVQVFELQIHI